MSFDALNKAIDQSVGPFFESMGLQTPHLVPLEKKSPATEHATPANPEPAVSVNSFKRPEQSPAAPTQAQATATPSHKKPHRSAHAQPAVTARNHGKFTPSQQHAPNALNKLQQNKPKAIAPRQNTAWLAQANRDSEQELHPQIREPIRAVQDYCGAARTIQDPAIRHEKLQQAGQAMRELDRIAKDPHVKLNDHDRRSIAATQRIYANHKKANWGQVHEDPDLKLLRISHQRHTKGAEHLTRLPENSQLAKLAPQHSSPPKRLDPDKLPKEPWKKPGYHGPVPFEVAHSGKPHGPGPKKIALHPKGHS